MSLATENLTVSQLYDGNPKLDARIARLFPPLGRTACWPYFGGKKTAYPVGKIKIDGVWKTRRWSRVIYFIRNGLLPDGFQIAHVCQNRNCGNPGHLAAWPQEFHAAMDAHHRATTKRLKAGGFTVGHVVDRFDLSEAQVLDDASNLEIASDLCERMNIPMELATRLVQNDADIAALVEANCQQHPLLRRLLQRYRTA